MNIMKAVVCNQYGPPESHSIGELPMPEPKAHEVLIKVEAAGVNFPDLLIIQGQYQFQPPMPFSPGSEVAGVVTAVGENVKTIKAGQRVMALTGFGAFAEYAVAAEFNTFPIPDNLDSTTAAGFSLVYGTSYYALKQRAHIQPNETLLVLGAAGGVGLTAVELGKVMGAKVIAAASSDEKLELAKKYGADLVINYEKENLKERVKALTNGVGADVIYDPVGGDYFEQALRAINWQGRMLVIGFASGSIPKVPVNLTLLKGCQIVGVFWGAFTSREPNENTKNFDELLSFYEKGQIKPLISTALPMSKFSQGLQKLANRKIMGKLVLTMDL